MKTNWTQEIDFKDNKYSFVEYFIQLYRNVYKSSVISFIMYDRFLFPFKGQTKGNIISFTELTQYRNLIQTFIKL